MTNFDKFMETFINGDFFLIFLVLLIIILLILVMALIKSREDYNELLNANGENEKEEKEEPILNVVSDSEGKENSIFDELFASDNTEKMDPNTPLINQIDLNEVNTYEDEIAKTEMLDEEEAVISTDELFAKRDIADLFGDNVSNMNAINKYEEEQESKAIISYEQLLKNASNVTLSYQEEKKESSDAPIVKQISVHQDEIIGPEKYLAEDDFLRILKEFRVNLDV